MARQFRRSVAVGALLASGALLGGCERRDIPLPRRDTPTIPVPKDSREVGREVGDAARDAKESTDRFFEGVREGYGGSGSETPSEPAPEPTR